MYKSSTWGHMSAGGSGVIAARPSAALAVMGLKKLRGSKVLGKLGVKMKRGASQSAGHRQEEGEW